jgi:hypothetical protein
MNTASFMVEQQTRRHIGSLNTWVNQVRARKTPVAALQAALSMEPSAPPIIRGMRSIYSAEQSRARRAIEARVMEHLSGLEDGQVSRECLSLAKRIIWSMQITGWARKQQVILQKKG